jgi:hypothetical protein
MPRSWNAGLPRCDLIENISLLCSFKIGDISLIMTMFGLGQGVLE